MKISRDDYFDLARSLVGLVVSRPWQGIGSTLFLELGCLTTKRYNLGRRGERETQKGEASIRLDWGWRFENDCRILCGSDDSRSEIGKFIQSIVGSTIREVQLIGAPPEISILLSTSIRLKSLATISGDPQWYTHLQDGRYLVCRDGVVIDGASYEGPSGNLSAEEAEFSARVKETADRWGKPGVEPVKGRCLECSDFIRIDGHFELLDYGVCGHSSGPLDGKVVHIHSGCPMFVEDRPT